MGNTLKIKNNNFRNHALIIEGADIFTRKINSPNLKSSIYNIDLYKKIIDGLKQNNINCLLRRHPKSKINWSSFNSNYFIENLEKFQVNSSQIQMILKFLYLLALAIH